MGLTNIGGGFRSLCATASAAAAAAGEGNGLPGNINGFPSTGGSCEPQSSVLDDGLGVGGMGGGLGFVGTLPTIMWGMYSGCRSRAN